MQPWYVTAIAVGVAIGAALAFAWSRSAGAATAPDNQPDIRAVVFHAPGPAWIAGVAFREQPGVQAHIAHYRALLTQRKLAMGGPFLDNSGGMMIAANGMTLDELKAFAAEDPAVKSGLLTFSVKPWMIGMKGG